MPSFKENGSLMSRGEEVSPYQKGDKVLILHQETQNSSKIVVRTGESKGQVAIVDHEFILFDEEDENN